MSTSPGVRGGASVFNTANNSFPRMGGNIVASFSLNNFETNYSDDKILDAVLYANFLKEIVRFEEAL
jgi:chromate reductase